MINITELQQFERTGKIQTCDAAKYWYRNAENEVTLWLTCNAYSGLSAVGNAYRKWQLIMRTGGKHTYLKSENDYFRPVGGFENHKLEVETDEQMEERGSKKWMCGHLDWRDHWDDTNTKPSLSPSLSNQIRLTSPTDMQERCLCSVKQTCSFFSARSGLWIRL